MRVRREDGVLFTLGPPQQFGEVVVPTWIRAETEQGFSATLRIDGVEPGQVPLTAFNPDWLYEVQPRVFPSAQDEEDPAL